MKTTIFTTLLAVGMLLRPQPVAVTDNGVNPDASIAITATQQSATQVLNAAEMNAAIGGETSGCYSYTAPNGDVYGYCCVDLWLFQVCVGVNWSAIERLIPF